jgi:aspartate 1-decarboxylase
LNERADLLKAVASLEAPVGQSVLGNVARSLDLPLHRQDFAMRFVMSSKIHNATVTEANLDYVGSITIDSDLIDRVGLWPGERVMVVSNSSGARLETYVIVGEAGSGTIAMNGAAAHLIERGDRIIVMGFELCPAPITPKVILVDEANRFVRNLVEEPGMVLA